MPDLAAYLDRIRAAHGDVPGFDPAGPGIAARLLILLETPGPRIGLTGVVSLVNPAGTARNLRRFLAETGIDGREVLLWNAVPWVIQPGGPIRPPRDGGRPSVSPEALYARRAYGAALHRRHGRAVFGSRLLLWLAGALVVLALALIALGH